MKRIAAILIALLLILAPAALAEGAHFSPFDHRTGSAGGGRYLSYAFPDIALLLPGDWDGRITTEQTGEGFTLYQTASLEAYEKEGIPGGGFLFRLCASADERFRELPAFEYLGFSENAGLHFYLLLPSDYPAYSDDEIRAEYDEMSAGIGTVVEKARIEPNIYYYPEGIEHTDAGMS